jgi:fatty acid desaturase
LLAAGERARRLAPLVTGPHVRVMLGSGPMQTDTPARKDRLAPIGAEQLRRLQLRFDQRGLRRLAGHLLAIGGTGWLYTLALQRSAHVSVVGIAAIGFGFTLVSMFAAMHESVHRTAFRSRWLNDTVAWFAGLLSFYNSTFYRPYHGWHHRFTQIPGKDPELEDKKPTSFLGYAFELSAVPWWIGKLTTYVKLARGKTDAYPFLSERTARGVVRSVRLQLLVYAAAIALSVWLGRPYFVTYWLLPVAVAQPLLRAILLAEHTGCAENGDALANTRTTYTSWPIRFLMWEMPYHAEHHLYPALPFFALAGAHQSVGAHLVHVARRGYVGVQVDFLKSLARKALPERAA